MTPGTALAPSPPRYSPVEVPPMPADPTFAVGDRVTKSGGDYRYEGHVVGVVVKLSGAVRYVVEDDRGMLFIFNGRQLEATDAR